MSNKLYYDDPLIAAYMGRDFGVYIEYVRYCPYGGEPSISKYGYRKIDGLAPFYSDMQKLRVHPDSYHIFEPQNGDFCLCEDKSGWADDFYADYVVDAGEVIFSPYTFLNNDSSYALFYENADPEVITILQREGKHFFAPLVEAIND